MAAIRKILIGITALAVVLGVFFVYNSWHETPVIKPPRHHVQDDLQMPDTTEKPEMNSYIPGPMDQSSYTTYDPQTKKLKRILGFQRLLNPNQDKEAWKLLKPYVKIFEDNFRCQIYSGEGTVQVERVQGSVSPRDAELAGDVEIHIQSLDPEDPAACTVYMDELTYSSERSEFSTDGPVKLISDEAELAGRGMTLIYNGTLGRIELLQIRDLDYIRLRNVATETLEGEPAATSPVAQASGPAAESNPSTPRTDAAQASVATGEAGPAGVDQTGADYYQCRLQKNVVIAYGDQLRVSGADEVYISNILWSSRSTRPGDEATDEVKNDETVAPAPIAAAPGVSGGPDSAAGQGGQAAREQVLAGPERTQPDYNYIDDDKVDVRITCDGGILITPMKDLSAQAVSRGGPDSPPDRLVTFSGRTVAIDRNQPKVSEGFQPLIRCGSLKYNFDRDILNLFTNAYQTWIMLAMTDRQARLEAEGGVEWDRRGNQARIDGPGKLAFASAGQAESERQMELAFEGVMHLSFAEAPSGEADAGLVLKAANLAGGMEAVLKSEQPSSVRAQTARFQFDEANQLAQADMEGGVLFVSENGRMDAEEALLQFGPDSTLRQADMSGQVTFGAGEDTIRSRRARVDFDEDSQPSFAELTGGVQVASASGNLLSERARIHFTRDDLGKAVAGRVETLGASTLEPAQQGGKPARFQSQRIDYDVQTGQALAHGPVHFTFYMPSDPNDPNSPEVPVNITASRNAEYDANRGQITFNEDVLGVREVDMDAFVQKDSFTGDQLVVSLAAEKGSGQLKQASGSGAAASIRSIAVLGKEVRVESQRYDGPQTISHVRMTCRRLDYDALEDKLIASGPGDIQLNNANVPEPPVRDEESRLDLTGPCYAVLHGYDRLEWHMIERRVRALGENESINIGYWPVENGRLGKRTWIGASNCQASFEQTPAGRSQLASMSAIGGLYYEEEGGNVLFGETMSYDGETGMMVFEGAGPNDTCFLNGVSVPQIVYNAQTGRVESQLGGPGVVPVPPRQAGVEY